MDVRNSSNNSNYNNSFNENTPPSDIPNKPESKPENKLPLEAIKNLGSNVQSPSVTSAQAQSMVKELKGPVNYQYIVPKVDIPKELHKSLSTEQIHLIADSCISDYKESLHTLEASVADVAATHPDALEFADNLSGRLMTFLNAYAQVLLEGEERINASTPENVKQTAIVLKVNEMLIDIMAEKKENPSSSSVVVQGVKDEAGSVGLNLLSIRKAISEGNLREKMYFPYKCTWRFTNAILRDLEMSDKINQKLKETNAGFELNMPMLKTVQEKNLPPYAYTTYANSTRDDKLRAPMPIEEKTKLVQNNPPINAQRRIELSERELRHATGELSPSSTKMPPQMQEQFHEKAKNPVEWTPGSYLFRPLTNADREIPHDYLTAIEAVRAPAAAGISGTLDLILTMGIYFGMDSKEDLQKGRLACLGWMLDSKDHSINEIMTASKGFGFEYVTSPQSYAQIYPEDEHFVDNVRQAQISRGSDLPDHFLSEDWAKKKAVELFPQRFNK